jgi:hypothetical protein
MSKVILVAGTWAYDEKEAWWKPGSLFHAEGLAHGLDYLDDTDPFVWDTKLDGVKGVNEVWQSAGKSLLWYTHLKDPGSPVSLIAHSHGGQVVAYAAAFGLMIDKVITVATPVRSEVPYAKLALQSADWIHIYGGVRDYVQIFGELAAGSFRMLQRQMPLADSNICESGRDHSQLHDPKLWTDKHYWNLVN